MTRAAYRAGGIRLPETQHVALAAKGQSWAGAMILAPPSARGSPWARRFGAASTGFASGWMQIRGARRRRAIDRGFVLSDHADWPALQQVVRETGAERIGVTHGYVGVMKRWLQEQGFDAREVATPFQGEDDEEDVTPEESVL